MFWLRPLLRQPVVRLKRRLVRKLKKFASVLLLRKKRASRPKLRAVALKKKRKLGLVRPRRKCVRRLRLLLVGRKLSGVCHHR